MTDIRQWLQGEPEEVATLPQGGNFVPIEALEKMLDQFDSWGTQNFQYTFYRDGYAKWCIAASIEVVVEYPENDRWLKRSFVGTSNFEIAAIYPIKHFLSTAKSECVKNACSDIGRRLGRGINPPSVPDPQNIEVANEGISFVSGLE